MIEDKKFEWTDALVSNFANLVHHNGWHKFYGASGIERELEDFKASHSIDEGRDWEVEWMEAENGGLHKLNQGGGSCKARKCKIFSVKRKSDGVVFSVGDEVVHKTDGLINVSKILSLFIPESKYSKGKMWFHFEHGTDFCKDLSNFDKLPPERSKLFTDFNGNDIYVGDRVWWVVIHASGDWTINNDIMKASSSFSHDRVFSTREKAIEYITLNKPCLSVKECIDVLGMGCFKPFLDSSGVRLKDFAKSKINEK